MYLRYFLTDAPFIHTYIHTYINTYSQSARVPVVITVALEFPSPSINTYIQPVSQHLEREPEHKYITYIHTFYFE